MAPAQKPDLVFRRNGRVHLNRRGRQFSQLLAAEVCASAVVIFRGSVRVLATHPIRQFPLHFPSRVSQCAIRFQLDSTNHGRIPNRLKCSAKFHSIHNLQMLPIWSAVCGAWVVIPVTYKLAASRLLKSCTPTLTAESNRTC
jgi:hypothetical protein